MAKEILKEELLDDEQLDNVAGGTLAQTAGNIKQFACRTAYTPTSATACTPTSPTTTPRSWTRASTPPAPTTAACWTPTWT